MAKRNMIQTVNKAKETWHTEKYLTCYDLSMDEINELVELAKHNIVKAICTGFDYGFILGVRATNKKRISDL